MNKLAIYPGSFDPITNGHLDILIRSLKVFDKVIVLIASNPNKRYDFSAKERIVMVKEAVADFKNVSVDYTDGLSAEYAKKVGASHLIRGLRAVTDFEYEFQLAAANHFVSPEVDEIFFMASSDKTFISSSMISELQNHGEDISSLVPPSVVKAYLRKKNPNYEEEEAPIGKEKLTKIFKKHGYSVKQIAQELGLTTVSIYLRIEGKMKWKKAEVNFLNQLLGEDVSIYISNIK